MPLVSTVQTHATFTPSHHRLILGTAADILQSESIAELLNIPDNLWGFVTDQLSHTTELQLILEQKKVVFKLLPSKHSRHNSPSNTNKITQVCRKDMYIWQLGCHSLCRRAPSRRASVCHSQSISILLGENVTHTRAANSYPTDD